MMISKIYSKLAVLLVLLYSNSVAETEYYSASSALNGYKEHSISFDDALQKTLQLAKNGDANAMDLIAQLYSDMNYLYWNKDDKTPFKPNRIAYTKWLKLSSQYGNKDAMYALDQKSFCKEFGEEEEWSAWHYCGRSNFTQSVENDLSSYNLTGLESANKKAEEYVYNLNRVVISKDQSLYDYWIYYTVKMMSERELLKAKFLDKEIDFTLYKSQDELVNIVTNREDINTSVEALAQLSQEKKAQMVRDLKDFKINLNFEKSTKKYNKNIEDFLANITLLQAENEVYHYLCDKSLTTKSAKIEKWSKYNGWSMVFDYGSEFFDLMSKGRLEAIMFEKNVKSNKDVGVIKMMEVLKNTSDKEIVKSYILSGAISLSSINKNKLTLKDIEKYFNSQYKSVVENALLLDFKGNDINNFIKSKEDIQVLEKILKSYEDKDTYFLSRKEKKILKNIYEILYDIYSDNYAVKPLKNEKKKLEFLAKGAEVGNAYLEDIYAVYLEKQKKQKESLDFYKRASVQGNNYSSYSLGFYYENGGVGLVKNYEKALEYYEKAAKNDYAPAQCEIAIMYGLGFGVKQSQEKSKEIIQFVQDYNPNGNASRCKKGYEVLELEKIILDKKEVLNIDEVYNELYAKVNKNEPIAKLIETVSEKDEQKNLVTTNDLDDLLSKAPMVKVDGKKWLFAIGLENYKYTDSIIYAKRSAEMFVKVAQKTLGVSTQNTYLLINENATSSDIKNKMKLMLRNVKEGDTIYFYYNGHGVPAVDKGNEPFILSTDMMPDFVGDEPAFMMKQMYKELSDSKAGSIIAVVDSCFSGSADGKSIQKGVVATRMRPKAIDFDKTKMVVLTAGKDTQYSNAYNQKAHRMFSYFVMEELLKGDKNIKEVYGSVYKNTKEMTRANYGDMRIQEPTMDGNTALSF